MAIRRLADAKPFVRVKGPDDQAGSDRASAVAGGELGHVDIVVTPGEVVRTRTGRQSPGAIWEALDDAKIAAIPVLADQRPD